MQNLFELEWLPQIWGIKKKHLTEVKIPQIWGRIIWGRSVISYSHLQNFTRHCTDDVDVQTWISVDVHVAVRRMKVCIQLMDASVGLLKSQGDSLGHVKVSYLLQLEWLPQIWGIKKKHLTEVKIPQMWGRIIWGRINAVILLTVPLQYIVLRNNVIYIAA